MKDGHCPKCGSDDVRMKKDGMAGGNRQLMITNWTASTLEPYVCTNCGFLESYVPDKNLDTIREKWDRIGRIFDGH